MVPRPPARGGGGGHRPRPFRKKFSPPCWGLKPFWEIYGDFAPPQPGAALLKKFAPPRWGRPFRKCCPPSAGGGPLEIFAPLPVPRWGQPFAKSCSSSSIPPRGRPFRKICSSPAGGDHLENFVPLPPGAALQGNFLFRGLQSLQNAIPKEGCGWAVGLFARWE